MGGGLISPRVNLNQNAVVFLIAKFWIPVFKIRKNLRISVKNPETTNRSRLHPRMGPERRRFLLLEQTC